MDYISFRPFNEFNNFLDLSTIMIAKMKLTSYLLKKIIFHHTIKLDSV
jgi:hypothetical protein